MKRLTTLFIAHKTLIMHFLTTNEITISSHININILISIQTLFTQKHSFPIPLFEFIEIFKTSHVFFLMKSLAKPTKSLLTLTSPCIFINPMGKLINTMISEYSLQIIIRHSFPFTYCITVFAYNPRS